VKVDSAKITVTAADRFRTLGSQACGMVNAVDYPVAADKSDALGKPLPVVFGTVTLPLIEIAYTETEDGGNVTVNAKYLAAGYISSFSGLYAEDGTGLPYSLQGAVIVFFSDVAQRRKSKAQIRPACRVYRQQAWGDCNMAYSARS
jgi:hypothetical protein